MAATPQLPTLVQQKIAVFERMQPEFEQCFEFVQNVHGQRRLSRFPVADTVRYLHARWITECKGLLLSVPHSGKGNESRLCLELLLKWQSQLDTTSVVAFLYEKLDMLPLTQFTRQVHEARHLKNDEGLAQRLVHGRFVLLNRGYNLMHALDAIFALEEEDLAQEVRQACERYGHRPEQIEQQLEEMNSPLYSYMPHQELAQKNMQLMNKIGIDVTSNPADRPGERSWRVVQPSEPLSPYAEHIVEGYQELNAPQHNNIKHERFIDRPERSKEGEV